MKMLKPSLPAAEVVTFWETRYLPYIEAVVPLTGMPRRKPSTTRGFRQIWNQHLRQHFGECALRDYEPAMGKRFLRTLTSTQGKTTLKHIKALAGSLFGYAVDEEFIKVNPWHDVKIPDDAIESAATKYYTLPEVEDIVAHSSAKRFDSLNFGNEHAICGPSAHVAKGHV
jgi:hypothetical protein